MLYQSRNANLIVKQVRAVLKKRRLNVCAYILMACLTGVLPLAVGHSAADAFALAMTEETRHDILSPASEEHGHVHEGGESEERLPGHVHGHNPLDHSHETPSVMAVLSIFGPEIFPVWDAGTVFTPIHGPPHLIERPPRNI
tara:strand:- start:6275 stop:6700 length:426 start_codon:yes stop_codon:yes gene_type:complete